jgi:pyruvate,water dikinase
LIHPRWGDEPNLLWNQIKAMVETAGNRPREANLAAASRRGEAQAKALASLSGWRSLYRRPLLKRLFAYNEIYAALRDNHRFYYDYVWWLLRRAYREKGRRLAAEGRLDKADDVFFLSRGEIEALAGRALSTETAASRISVRRTEWEETRRSLPPKFLHQGCAPLGEASASASGDRLVGIPASPGEVSGRARIALDIRDLDRFQAGEILVTRQTDPAWTPAFARLSGLVLETGGALAHGASLCREFGLPCVTAVEDATTLIHDGDLLLLSGGDGAVQIIDRAPTAAVERQPSTRGA